MTSSISGFPPPKFISTASPGNQVISLPELSEKILENIELLDFIKINEAINEAFASLKKVNWVYFENHSNKEYIANVLEALTKVFTRQNILEKLSDFNIKIAKKELLFYIRNYLDHSSILSSAQLVKYWIFAIAQHEDKQTENLQYLVNLVSCKPKSLVIEENIALLYSKVLAAFLLTENNEAKVKMVAQIDRSLGKISPEIKKQILFNSINSFQHVRDDSGIKLLKNIVEKLLTSEIRAKLFPQERGKAAVNLLCVIYTNATLAKWAMNQVESLCEEEMDARHKKETMQDLKEILDNNLEDGSDKDIASNLLKKLESQPVSKTTKNQGRWAY